MEVLLLIFLERFVSAKLYPIMVEIVLINEFGSCKKSWGIPTVHRDGAIQKA
jgi:hypothetical protein